MAKDYYSVLGVDKKADKKEIKTAFRKLAQEHHPDKGGSEERFKEINEAYQVLSDDKKRAEYDTYGQTFGAGGGPGGFDFSQAGFNVDLGDIFGEFFAGRGRGPVRGRDISIDIELSFAESVFGAERKVLLTKNSICSKCNGNGAKEGTELESCKTCNGQGSVREVKRTFLGNVATETICSTCKGKTKVPKEPCDTCNGEGIENRTEEITIPVPPGVDNGEMVRMQGLGEAISGGAAGDLYIKIHVKADPNITRLGRDLRMDLPVKLSDALLGAEYPITTLDGEINVKVPAGVSHGEQIELVGKGVPDQSGNRGKLLIRIMVKMPNKLSKKAREHIEGLQEEGI